MLKEYLAAYTKALKDKPPAAQPFRKAYIDAFAGSGSRAAVNAKRAICQRPCSSQTWPSPRRRSYSTVRRSSRYRSSLASTSTSSSNGAPSAANNSKPLKHEFPTLADDIDSMSDLFHKDP